MPKEVRDEAQGSPYTEELRELVERARQGDQSVMPRLTELLDETPDLWRQVGDIAKHVESHWVRLLAGEDLFTSECVRRELQQRRIDLLGKDASPMERHLVERVVACWLQLQYAEIQAAAVANGDLKQQRFAQKRLENAQRQHAATLKSLKSLQRSSRKRKQEKAKRRKSKDQAPTSFSCNVTSSAPCRKKGREVEKRRFNGHVNNRIGVYLDQNNPV